MYPKVTGTIQNYNMFQQGDRLAVGVSGGADSVALLHFLRFSLTDWKLELFALHLNHQIRGEEADRDEAFVRRLCGEWNIPFVTDHRPVPELAKNRGLSLEECAREERYAFFRAQARRLEAKIATAHTASDSAETVLLNLARGTGLRGLCGIPPVRDGIVRPLIECTRGEIEAYCLEQGLAYITDSTNRDERYSRNKIRRKILPVLRELNPSLEEGILGMTGLLRRDADYLDGLARAERNRLDRKGVYDTAELVALPVPIRARVLLQLLAERGLVQNRRQVGRLEELIQAGSGAVQLSPDCRAVCHNREFQMEDRWEEQSFFRHEIDILSLPAAPVPVFFGKSVQFMRMDYEYFEKTNKDPEKALKNALDYDRMNKIVSVRQRLPGDQIALAGRGCTKSLKKLFNEQGTPLPQRGRTVVLAQDGRPIWVEGFGPDREVCVRSGRTRRVLLVKIMEGQECGRISNGF